MIITLSMGLLTHHIIGADLDYCNQINNIGTISNTYFTLTAGEEKGHVGVIAGQDSVCGNIFGGFGEYFLTKELGVVLGAYNTNTRRYNDRGINPLSIEGTEITPILGLNYKISLHRNERYGIILNNLVTPYILSSSIGIQF